MIIEIFVVISAFISGYFIGLRNGSSKNRQKLSKSRQFTLNSQVRMTNKTVQNKTTRKQQEAQPAQQNDEQKTSNKKKKNKKKRRQSKQQKQLQQIKQQQQRDSGNIGQGKSSGQDRSSGQGRSSDKQQQRGLWSSAQLNSDCRKSTSSQRAQLSRSCQLVPLRENKQSEQQQMADFISDQIQLMRSYFLDEFQQIVAYNKKCGKCRLTLLGTAKQMTLQWSYNNSNYPKQFIQIEFVCDKLKPIEVDRLNRILDEHKDICSEHNQRGKFYNYVFNVSTSIYQDLLMHLNQQPEDTLQTYKQDLHHPHHIPHTGLAHDIFTEEKKQIYGKLVEEIFYMQDFKSEPNDSLLINNHVQSNQKKNHPRGRYVNQFEQLEMVGVGGFGKVYKARNRLDSNTYAIKKITINYESSKDRKLLNQVTLLSTLNHPNIVRYHQCWLQDISSKEQLFHDLSVVESQEKEGFEHMYQEWIKSRGGIHFQGKPTHKQEKLMIQEEDNDIMFQEDDGIQFQGYSQIQFQQASRSVSRNPNRNLPTFSQMQDSESVSSEEGEKGGFPFKVLYIVMQFCRGINLGQFISSRFKQEQIKIQIIRGILEGLAYIHSKKIIHRDLKPANIFLTENNKVKIGDFGLATVGMFEEKLLHQVQEEAGRSCEFQKTIGIGTGFYRAPQQLKSSKYDEKVDIYSLGIIILEMFYKFNTLSQRSKLLTDLTKTFQLPKHFNLEGRISDYQISIENCIKQRPEARPTARKLLQNFRNKYFVLLVSAIANPKYAQFYQLIKHLFQISNQRRVQSVRKNYFRPYDFQQILQIYKVHRGNMFPSFPLMYVNDYKTINGFKIQSHQSRKEKFLVMTQQGVLLQYTANLYAPWIIYAKQTMRRRKTQYLNNQLAKVQEMRRFAFQKIIWTEYDSKKEQTSFKEKFITGFDICYDLETGFSPFLTLEILIISSSLVQTLHFSQQHPPLFLCHSKIFIILSKHYKIPLYQLYSCLLSLSQQKLSTLTEGKRLEYFQKYQIQGLAAKKISQLLQQTYEGFDEWIQAMEISNIKEYIEYLEINEQIKRVMKLNQCFQLQGIEYKLMVPVNSCNGLFWSVGPVRGFTAVEDYNTGTLTGYLCNLNLQMTLSQGHDACDVSMWSNQEFLEPQIMELIEKCWRMGVSAKFYEQAMGEKDQTSRMNMIIKKKKGERVHYNIRKNQAKKYGAKSKFQEGNKQLSSVVLKQQFNHEVFRQIHQLGTTNNWMGWNKKKSQQKY